MSEDTRTPGGVALPSELIGRKRDGGSLTEDELRTLVEGYLEGRVGEGQIGAFLMAGVLRGFSRDEAIALTRIFVESGAMLEQAGLPGPTVDKHSTGGVGDGTTLLVAPTLAACGVTLVKLSGRGLGHTGGTLDKLESIPGFRVDLDGRELYRVASEVGCVVAAQTNELVPADRELYALRDVTGTVESTALIASSVMSKKLAAGSNAIVLDVKAGEGAFMASEEAAAELAELCVEIGEADGRRTVALVTAMDQPLGTGIGNALEVAECVRLLEAEPQGRLAELAAELAATGLALATETDLDAARERVRDAWSSGASRAKLREMIVAQGGDPGAVDNPAATLPQAPVQRPVPADAAGCVRRVAARGVGELAAWLGAGRARKGDPVDPAVGLDLHVAIGDEVEAGQALATVHARDDATADEGARRLGELIEVGAPTEAPPTLLRRVGSV
ncbi:thymidine phosphorylase [Egibacter rhizosphaerae]|uniref:Thymidine phosphorylase n=1 Tax=Egibacter rhizosphaerae TaxID=1670831 RepID=A0A411YK85_9ACTN|nr:thymidine phosphorylase [Egibacter rhizosphaerae]QBI21590.1 thymidine phosphorylase [Egibacter rhizosphaerae]